MHPLDLTVLAAYLGATWLIAARFVRRHRSAADYFVTGRRVPWWAVMASIVATETSTITFVSIPGVAFTGDLRFLQLALGYQVGRVAIVLFLMPAYFRGELMTAYELLGTRFDSRVRRIASGIFIATRSLADGLRLFATGLIVAIMLLSVPAMADATDLAAPWLAPTAQALVAAVIVLGFVTIAYTWVGGMTAVIWTDVAQLVLYLTGALAAAAILLDGIPGGLTEAWSVAADAGKLRIFDFSMSLTQSYTVWSGVIGGAFLTAATHGTDQLLVQRYLSCSSARQASLALLVSGVVVFAQFALFLGLGLLLYVFYTHHAPAGELAAFTTPAGQLQPDRILPTFIVNHLPPGLAGLVCASALAAAMSTLSSSLNSLSAASVNDFYRPWRRLAAGAPALLVAARRATLFWGFVLVAVALAAIGLSQRVVDEVLGIASFTNGLVLGLFVLGVWTAVSPPAAFLGVAGGAMGMLAIRVLTAVSWQWYVLAGAVLTVGCGLLAHRLLEGSRTQGLERGDQ